MAVYLLTSGLEVAAGREKFASYVVRAVEVVESEKQIPQTRIHSGEGDEGSVTLTEDGNAVIGVRGH